MLNVPKYRPDIDGLRAFAVLAVVGYHAFPELVRGGFIGVDIFFVVSGYLISSLVLGSLEKGSFSFAQFYARRIKRLFPALLLVLVAVVAFGWFVLLPDEYEQLGKHVAAGAGFVSNIVLWREAGYFDVLATIKPLLHLWSLGIEEQFYLVWPLVLYLVWRRRSVGLPVILLVAGASLSVNLVMVVSDAAGAFYLPQSRFFELLAGSALAMLGPEDRLGTAARQAAATLGLLLVAAALVLVNQDKAFPGWWALLPTVGTCLIVAAGPGAWLNRRVLARPALVWIGLISYPLYLWHWPLLSFARIIERDQLAPALSIALVLASVALAWMTYELVEKPIRFGPHANAKVAVLCALMLGAGLAGSYVYRSNGLPFRDVGDSAKQIVAQAEWPYWADPACVEVFATRPCQASSGRPRYLLLGDSHANHLYPGLVLTAPALDVIQVGGCPPLVDVTMRVQKNQSRHPCASTDFLASNMRILQRNPEIRTVIVAALWKPALTGVLFNDRERDRWGRLTLVPARSDEAGKSNRELVVLGLTRTIAILQSRGLNVVLVRDTPDTKSELVEYCKFSQRFKARDCAVPRRDYLELRRDEDALLRELLAEFPMLAVYDPIDTLCDQTSCYLMRDGELRFRDHHHLSVNGSKRVAEDLKKWMARQGFLDSGR